MRPDMTLWKFCLKQRHYSGSARYVCSRILNFICKKKYRNIWTGKKQRNEIKERFSHQEHILYRWSVSSSYVDYIGGNLWINSDDLIAFLKKERFHVDNTYNPDRWTRKDWFFNIVQILDETPENKDENISSVLNSITKRNISTDEKGRNYVLSETGVRVFEDFRDNLIIDRDDPVIMEQGNRWRYKKGLVQGLSYLGSENSEDAITWNVFRTLMKSPTSEWFSSIFPFIYLTDEEYKNIQFAFWKEFPPPSSRTVRVGNTHVDLTVETPEKLIFIEVKYKSEISISTTYDSERDQIIRNIDVGSSTAKERDKEFYFVLLITKENVISINKFNYYKNKPERIEEKIGSYRDDIGDYREVADHMYILYWEEICKTLRELKDYLGEKFEE